MKISFSPADRLMTSLKSVGSRFRRKKASAPAGKTPPGAAAEAGDDDDFPPDSSGSDTGDTGDSGGLRPTPILPRRSPAVKPPSRLGSALTRFSHSDTAHLLVYGMVLPLLALVLLAAGWYIVTGETIADLWGHGGKTAKVSLPLTPLLPPDEAIPQMLPPGRSAAAGKPGAVPPAAGGPSVPPAAIPAPPAPPPPPATAASATQTPAAGTAPPPASPAGRNEPSPATGGSGGSAAPSAEPTPAAPAQVFPVARAQEPPPFLPDPPLTSLGDGSSIPGYQTLASRNDLAPLDKAAPKKTLLQDAAFGKLPVTSGGEEARTAYARPFSKPADGTLKVAVIVVGLGLSKEATEAAISRLPPEICLSFSPYASGLSGWVQKARAAGHEVLVDLPLEPPNYPVNDSGPLSLLARHSGSEAQDNLQRVLAAVPGAVGVASSLRSPVASSLIWPDMMREIRDRGLLFAGDAYVGVPLHLLPVYAPVGLVIDDTPSKPAIDTRLERLMLAAKRDGQAIAYASPRPLTFSRLSFWAAKLSERNAVLAPVSALTLSPSASGSPKP